MMITLNPIPRRIAYVVLFEGLAIVLATFLLAAVSGGEPHANFPVAIASSTAAVIWNFLYNTLFERWERRQGVIKRSLTTRIIHTLGFEGGLVVVLIPLFMWWYSVGPVTAMVMEAALLVFFLIYTFVFTWLFDLIFRRLDV